MNILVQFSVIGTKSMVKLICIAWYEHVLSKKYQLLTRASMCLLSCVHNIVNPLDAPYSH